MEIFIILGLIILNGLFSMAEIALVSSRRARLETQANKGDLRARDALKLTAKPDNFLSTVQIGITLISILTGIFSGEHIKGDIVDFLSRFDFIRPYANISATVIAVMFITYLSLVIGELVPKRIGLSNPEKIAKQVAKPMQIVSWITYPFILLLDVSTNALVKLFGIRANESQVTEEEIKAIISEGTEQGTIEEAEQDIIERVFHLGDRNITSLMTHRSDIMWVDMNDTVEDVKKSTASVAHTVYPVCDDNIDNIKGVVFLKSLFLAQPHQQLKELMQPALYVPENNSAYQLLERFKTAGLQYAFIVDEYGTLQGIITLHDILKAIVGSIVPAEEDDYEITKREDGSFLVDGQIPFYNFLSYFDKTEWIEEGEQEFDTIAGFILHHLQHIPLTGEKLHWRGFDMEILDMDGHRIDKILVKAKHKANEEEEE
ncbi:HlyC/CorC family transporter [Deminuibacter soli]|uniref:HlyC/CorC family transporter n=1 Tax=Deminuibacter soli TaxID=2291815 RepID=A0A3E1NMM4_9BACT|nr:HlyC/CorC family transporter [Deminuibacter soli]